MDLREELQRSIGATYTLERELGGGGMSRVFVATETALGRQVVMKVLPPEMAERVSAERFKREIAVVAQLQHAHIVPLHTAGEAAGLPYFTMPYVKGESLRARLTREGELPVKDTVRILREVASALAFAHESGVVHRDVKPDNVLLSGGAAMVTDFGVAKAIAASVPGEAEGLTSRGVALGTPAYMAPEQASADPHIDHRADLYAWGVLAYELLTGGTPFGGRPASATLAAQVTEAPEPVNRRRPAISPELAALVMKCLEKRPADRVQTAQEIVHALDDITTPSGGAPATSAGRGLQTRRVAMTGVAILVLAAVAFKLITRAPKPFVTGRATAVVSTSEMLELDAAISPDGKLVAYSAGLFPNRRILVRQIAGGRTLDLSGELRGDHRWPKWSPDGATILFRSESGIYAVPAFGGRPAPLIQIRDVDGTVAPGMPADWSPTGTQIVYSLRDSLWIQSLDGGSAKAIAWGGSLVAPAWSPSGRLIAFVRGNSSFASNAGNMSPSAIWMVRADGGEPWPVTDSARLNFGPVWTPDNRTLLFVSDRDGTRDVYSQTLAADGRPSGTPRRITSGLHAYNVSLSADGTRMAYSVLHLRRNVWMASILPDKPTAFAAARQVTRENQTVEGLALSHDGRWLLYDTNRDGNEDIFKLALDDSTPGSEPIRLTRDPADDFLARSSSTNAIVFYSTRFGTRDIFVMTADGKDVVRVTNLPSQEVYPDWHPDGTQIVYASAGRFYVVGRLRDNGWSEPRELAVPQCGNNPYPRWSPDGRWIAAPCGPLGVALVSPDSAASKTVPVAGVEVNYAEWGHDPNVVFVRERSNGQIWSISLLSGKARLLLRRDDSPRFAPRQEFATDGKRLFFTLAADEADIWVMELSRP